MKRTDPQMRIRLPAEVKRWLDTQAAQNMRSLNAEVVLAIKEKMATTGDEIGVMAPAEAGNNNHQETIDAERI